MIYSIHTFELTLTLATKDFNSLVSQAYKNAKKKHKVFEEKGVRYDMALSKRGIKIEYHNGTYKKKVKFIINPSRVLGGDDLKLWNSVHPTQKPLDMFEYLVRTYSNEGDLVLY